MIDRLKKLSLALLAIVLITSGCLRNSSNANNESVTQTSTIDTTSELSGKVQPDITAADELIQTRLKGKWQRTDGNYYLQIFSVLSDSTLKAGYYNPNTINVEKGEWTIQEGRFYLRVILRDVNYPGSTYSLGYDPENDLLAGKYYQAVEGVYYDVIFSRVR
ncbi:MAG TPA: hypothetical protein VMV74_02575 [Bacteroidales bacterium]|nr:hypothetical protein [Bacteroidales bacterium]